MYVKTNAIVLSHKKIRDNAVLLTLYTEELGRESFLLYGAGSKRGGKGFSLLHPLSLLSVEATLKNGKELNVIKEIKCLHPLLDSISNPYKSSILFFLAEMLTNVLRTNESDKLLFQFLQESVLCLNDMERGVCNFHIAFLVRLASLMGFSPNVCDLPDAHYFDLRQGEYTDQRPEHKEFVGDREAQFLRVLCRMNYRNLSCFRFTQRERNDLLERIINYYRIHLQDFRDLKSLDVLREVFD